MSTVLFKKGLLRKILKYNVSVSVGVWLPVNINDSPITLQSTKMYLLILVHSVVFVCQWQRVLRMVEHRCHTTFCTLCYILIFGVFIRFSSVENLVLISQHNSPVVNILLCSHPLVPVPVVCRVVDSFVEKNVYFEVHVLYIGTTPDIRRYSTCRQMCNGGDNAQWTNRLSHI